MQSNFHRSGDLCGSCHDVSNPAVGDLAPGNGTQDTAPSVTASNGNLGGPIEEKAAFNNPPYAYGIVERTFSEWKSGALDTMDVRDFTTLPSDMQVTSGALNMAYQSAMLAGGTYEDGTPRTFTCQGCHMRADIGEGCNKPVPTRSDLPKHDLTGGNYWVWPLIKYQDQQGTLRLGGGLTTTQLAAMDAGQIRGEDQLRMAASLNVDEINNTVTITNLTGHKLITGYPEGRRMWLNIKWYDINGSLVREDGEYGGLGVTITNPVDGTTFEPQSILDLNYEHIYEAHPAITKEWAALLTNLPGELGPYYQGIPIGFDRLTGAETGTLADIAGQDPETYEETFHFVLNNYVAKDNRIPPFGMNYETARVRNALPVPDTQYGDPNAGGTGGTYNHWDTVNLEPPTDAVSAEITLYYQGTSWEYVQFLWLANTLPAGSFLADEGVNFLDAWVKTGMVPPFAMATATWGQTVCNPIPEICTDGIDNDCDGFTDGDDLDCQCAITEPTEATCNDGFDNDCDGFTDGDDFDCQGQTTCSSNPDKGSCQNDPNCVWNGRPNNGFCTDAPSCEPTPEICNDGVDNDCDGFSDCADNIDCGADPLCQATDCSVYTTRNLCNAQGVCSWDSKNKVCVNL
jgi:hypothetical protein